MNDRTQIDLILNEYWKNYQKQVPIDLLYESQLRQCNLDESVESLKDLDGFLSNVRKDVQDKLTKAGRILSAEQRKSLLLKDIRFRRLIQFIGFYTGRVLSRVWKSQSICLDAKALQAMNPHYLSSDSFEHSLAIIFADFHKRNYLQHTNVKDTQEPWLFFVIEPIFMRLFGGFDYQIDPIQSNHTVADGLYRSVLQRLPATIVEKIKQKQNSHPMTNQTAQAVSPKPKSKPRAKSFTDSSIDNRTVSAESALSKTNVIQQSKQEVKQISKQSTGVAAAVSQLHGDGLHAHGIHNHPEQFKTQFQSTQTVKNSNPDKLENGKKPLQTHTHAPIAQTAEEQMADEMLLDIQAFQVSQEGKNEEVYVKASKIMQKFDSYAHIQKQKFGKLSSELIFDEKREQTRVKALQVIQAVAEAGNTNAMLHLSAYLLAGRWMNQNHEESITLLQKAINKQDARAMRTLSKLYYQGLGVQQDTTQGKYWIEKAAELGHPDAKQVVTQFELAQSMLLARTSADKSDKKYLFVIAVVMIIALLIVILL